MASFCAQNFALLPSDYEPEGVALGLPFDQEWFEQCVQLQLAAARPGSPRRIRRQQGQPQHAPDVGFVDFLGGGISAMVAYVPFSSSFRQRNARASA